MIPPSVIDETRGQPPSPGGDALRIVTPRFGPTVVGGAETAMRRLGHALQARGWSVEVWTTTAIDEATWSPGFATGIDSDDGITIRRFPVVSRRKPGVFRRLSTAAYHLPSPLSAEHLWAVAQGPYAPSLVRALADADGVPTIFHPYLFHPILFGLPAAPHPRILCPGAHDEPALRLRVVRRALLAADALWFNTPEERELVIRQHPATAAIRSECGLMGVEAPGDVDAFAFAARHRVEGAYVYYGGRRSASKGFDQLLRGVQMARNLHPNLTLVLSGEAGHEPPPPWVRSVGWLSERERWEAIAGAAAVVVPGSLESLSLLALEAWAMGRPCIVNAESAVLTGHLARNNGGLPFHGPDGLARAVAEVLDHPDRAAAMGESGREYVARAYRWDLVEERLRRLLGMEAG